MSPDASQGPERTTAFEARILAALAARGFPAQVLWGAADPALPFGRFGEDLRVALGVAWILELPGKHFVQEDCPIEIAGAVAELVLKAR
jgi:pimeloyl-ACP methyl ester carboxylesterase